MVKMLILTALAAGLIAGAVIAVRWFRGDTAYEQALEHLDEEPALETGLESDEAPA